MKKRIWSLLMAAMLLLSVCGGALATEADQWSDRSISLLSVMLTDDSTGYEITVTDLEAGVAVTAYKIADITIQESTLTPMAYAWVGNVQTWVDTNSSGTTIQNATPEFFKSLGAAVEGMSLSTLTLALSGSEEAGYSAHTDEAKPGQYLILIKNGTKIYSPCIANIEPVYEDGAWKIKDVSIAAKSEEIEINKTINEQEDPLTHEPEKFDTVAIGDEITFDIYTDIPQYPTNNVTKIYTVTDTMSAGLDLNQGTVKVWGLKENAEPVSLTSSAAYTLVEQERSFTATFVYNSISTYDQIHIQYTAKLNANAELLSDANVNEVKLTYSNNPYSATDTNELEDEVNVYTYGLVVDKYDGSDTTKKLENAEFNLYKVVGQTRVLIKFSGEKGATYRPSAETTASEKLVTDVNGAITIDGLDEGSYELVETVAPAGGYTLMANPAPFTITRDATDPKVVSGKTTAHYTVEIANNTGLELPSTGGMGTTLFTIIGIALMAAVVVILVAMSRKKSKQAE